MKEYSCDSAAAVAGLARALMDRIEREDAWVSYLALDEPFLSGAYDCHQPEARTAALVADFTRTVAPQRPKLKIGLIEPYPTSEWTSSHASSGWSRSRAAASTSSTSTWT